MKKYNWQHPQWPNLVFDHKHAKSLAETFHQSYKALLGELQQYTAEQRQGLHLSALVDEASSTSTIEGINTDRESLRNSIARKKHYDSGNETKDPYSDSVARLVIEMRERRTLGLDHGCLIELQHSMISRQPKRLGENYSPHRGYRTFKDDMVIADGRYATTGDGHVFFVAPPSKEVLRMMSLFIHEFNATHPANNFEIGDSFARIALSHLVFESIHPFEDGNGRVGRAISDLALCQFLGHDAYIGLSEQILINKNEYYAKLNEASQHTVDVSEWVSWFGYQLIQSSDLAHEKLKLTSIENDWWRNNSKLDLNSRQTKVVSKLFTYGREGMVGGLTARKYMGMTSASKATATRDLADLVASEVITRMESSGRSTHYQLTVFLDKEDPQINTNHKDLLKGLEP